MHLVYFLDQIKQLTYIREEASARVISTSKKINTKEKHIITLQLMVNPVSI